MTNDKQSLWGAWPVSDNTTVELRAGVHLALVLVQAENRVQVDLAHAKAAALVDAAAELTALLAAGGNFMLDWNGILIGAAMVAQSPPSVAESESVQR